jgi:DNA replication and repair protein RecF
VSAEPRAEPRAERVRHHVVRRALDAAAVAGLTTAAAAAALLALLFAERDLLAERRGRRPLMLLDDVMSELDAERRELLGRLLCVGGQAVVTATDPADVPGADAHDAAVVGVDSGAVTVAL